MNAGAWTAEQVEAMQVLHFAAREAEAAFEGREERQPLERIADGLYRTLACHEEDGEGEE